MGRDIVNVIHFILFKIAQFIYALSRVLKFIQKKLNKIR